MSEDEKEADVIVQGPKPSGAGRRRSSASTSACPLGLGKTRHRPSGRRARLRLRRQADAHGDRAFYEFFVDDARLCVNVKAALVLNVLKALKLNDEVCRSTSSADPPATE